MKNAPSEVGLVWQFFGQEPAGFFVDIGANEPQAGSQTWFLESKGWQGILVEPLPHLAARLQAERPGSRVVQAACGPPGHPSKVTFHEAETSAHSGLRPNMVEVSKRYVATHEVPMLTLDEILASAGNPKVDFVSIDVEGMELEVLRGFDLQRHRPQLLLVEDHLYHWKTHFHLRRSGYRLVKRTGVNNWYIPAGQPFAYTSPLERLKLWRKVWPGTPWRAVKHRLALLRSGVE
jgi:FkbM family methyltransferase